MLEDPNIHSVCDALEHRAGKRVSHLDPWLQAFYNTRQHRDVLKESQSGPHDNGVAESRRLKPDQLFFG